ncbi:MAG: hypothetical protein NDI61_01020 [Bdellovibrionaceae bacterium]|nr:hypothetical protein [Pseudobdellovibrionaceae bacterium]
MPSRPRSEAGTALIVIDQEPIRRQAADEVHRLFQRLRQARHRVETFEAVDRPAFARWLHSEFHESLHETQKLQAKVFEAESLVHDVQMIRFATGCSYYQAYVNVMERRRLEELVDDAFGEDFGDGDENEREESSRERANRNGRARQEFEDEDESDFEDDEETSSRSSSARAKGTGGNRIDGDDDGDGTDEGLLRKTRRAFASVSDSLKQKYRELARLLHPDLRFGGDEWTNDLWARAQAAYSEQNVRELEDLLILSRVSLGENAGQESISDMQSATRFLKKSLAAVRRQVTRLKNDLAWDFNALKDRTRLQRRISYDLEMESDELRERLDVLEAQLARWSVPPRTRDRGTKTRRSPRRRSSWDLDF